MGGWCSSIIQDSHLEAAEFKSAEMLAIVIELFFFFFGFATYPTGK
jgi:hypothetical protein